MKISRSFYGMIGLLFVLAMVVIWFVNKPSRSKYPQALSNPGWKEFSNALSKPTQILSPVESFATNDERAQRMERMRKVWNVKKLEDMTDKEKEELTNKFVKRFKPAIQKWCNAYEGHTPINSEDVTLEHFNSRMGNRADRYQYIFMVNGYTLTLLDQ